MNENDSRNEVAGIILFFCAIALMLIFYLLSEDIFLVKVIHNLAFGMVGKTAAFLIPVSMLYAAVDYFLEKRKGVSNIRVRSVVLLVILLSALLAVSTMDFTYFRSLCVTSKEKYSAFKAIKLLWTSGINSNEISPMSNGKTILSGGMLGGGIAVALARVMGKVISIMFLVLLLLSQLIVMFKISIKKTAKRAVSKVNQVYRQQRPQRPVQRPVQPRPVQTPVQSAPVVPANTANDSRFVANASTAYGREILSGVATVSDPLNRRGAFDVDPKTGFAQVPGGNNASENEEQITYVDNTFSTEGAYEAPVADFSYTANPKNPRLRSHKDEKVPTFLEKEKRQDFYDLDGAVYSNGETDENAYSDEYAEESYDDEPIELVDDDEIVDDDPYCFEPVEEVMPVRSVRQPRIGGNVPVNPMNTVAPVAAPEEIPSEPVTEIRPQTVDNSNHIAINAGEDVNNGYSRTEGRVIESNAAPDPEPSFESSVSAPVEPQPAGKIISKRMKPYVKPSTRLLAPDTAPKRNANNDVELKAKATKLEETIRSFGIETKVTQITHGPAITRFELELMKAGIKVSRIISLQDDIALAMAAYSVRIEAPIPGTNRIGIELPNEKTSAVQLRGLIESPEFRAAPPLTVPLGRDIPGRPIMCNLAKMPHLLIAGSTGSGKSVCINTILTSILFNSSYDDVRMILVDPKVVELSIYNEIPHLIMPVVTDPKKAAGALKWAVVEMERRYKCFAESKVRDLAGYNEYLKSVGEKPLPLILIVIDELADLMTVAAKEVEESISRLAAMARAAGLHMIIATQRPSVDVITGVIKANVPSRIAFAVSSGVDSRTILDSVGAEKLLGKGDMLYAPLSAPKPIRGQGAFLSDKEVESVVNTLKERFGAYYDEDIMKAVELAANGGNGAGGGSGASDSGDGSDEDDLLEKAVETVIDAGNASVSILQRRLGIGYPRAARLIDVLEQKRFIGPFEGSKPRKVLITRTDWLEIKARGDK
ncbi:MAG: hypothetical protein MJ108_03465 [Saccharofermentans sp.]|nr:hypothetical protein [Saccharofermentans sp.]